MSSDTKRSDIRPLSSSWGLYSHADEYGRYHKKQLFHQGRIMRIQSVHVVCKYGRIYPVIQAISVETKWSKYIGLPIIIAIIIGLSCLFKNKIHSYL